jgi:hypothetical protein
VVAEPCKRGHAVGRDSDGHCSECRRQRIRVHYASNIEKERARSRKRPGGAERSRQGRRAEPERFRNYTRKYQAANVEKTLIRHAQHRAKIGGYACSLTIADIAIPECCPLLGIRLVRGTGVGGVLPSSPTLDKIIPELGYIPGNVWVISHRANSIKRNASLRELTLLVSNLAKEQRRRALAIDENGEFDGVCACGKINNDGVRCRLGATHKALPPRRMPWETEPRKGHMPWE